MRPVATSLVIHGLLALLLIGDRSARPEPPPSEAAVSFEIAELDPPAIDPPEVSGAGEGAAGEPSAGPRRREPAPSRPRQPELTPAPTPAPSPTVGSVTGSLDLGPPGGEGGSGLGGRGGRGRGTGAGTRGRGQSIAKKTRPEPKRSRARPPRLIYPTRFRPDRPGEVFVVLLTIDTEGYVDGVRLIRGVNPHDDAKALDAVWRFRYAPALDDRGRPRRAKVRQRFMLER